MPWSEIIAKPIFSKACPKLSTTFAFFSASPDFKSFNDTRGMQFHVDLAPPPSIPKRTHNNFISLPTPLRRQEVNLLDTPGHRDFLKTALRSSYKAHLAVLVVAATTGEFEAGWSFEYGTYKSLLHVMHTLGVQHIIVAINKMDSLRWSQLPPQGRYGEIVSSILEFCTKCALFREDQMTFIPMSAWKGDNVVVRSTDMPWFRGPTFIEALEKARDHLSVVIRSPLLPPSAPNAPLYPLFSSLLLNVKDAHKYVKTGKASADKVHRDLEKFVEGDEIKHPGVVATARVVAGTMGLGQTVFVWPPMKIVKELKVIDMFVITAKGKTRCSSARAGEEVVVALQMVPPYGDPGERGPTQSFFRHLRNATLSSEPMIEEVAYVRVLLRRLEEDKTAKKRSMRKGATHFSLCGSKRLVLRILEVEGEVVRAQVVYPVYVAVGETLFIVQNRQITFKGIITEVSQKDMPTPGGDA
eukprot:TRINITY_DN1503_c0_g2_i2.p1 TRINITY_DN1503_c0_g2~~TRINITY_DN1503_c0_g2_i2.p1  ORF type:complete len:469 (+),score=91.87 TRINITY_DN1503_c0_g2_i2:846-2252(+)